MFEFALALPRRVLAVAVHTVRPIYAAAEAVPRIATAVEELRDAAKHVERLATFAAEELPEVVHQLEAVREQLAAIERGLPAGTRTVTPARRRSG